MSAPTKAVRVYREAALIQAFRKPFDFAQVLLEWSEDDNLARGERTRFRLLAAMCEALRDEPYPKIRVAKVCSLAGMSYGSFYHYFPDKDTLIDELMTVFMDAFYRKYSEIHASGDRYWDIFWPIYFYIDAYDQNRGLMRVMTENLNQLPNVRKETVAFLNRWHRRLTKTFPEGMSPTPLNKADQSILAHLLGGMLDSLMHQIFVIENNEIKQFSQQKARLSELCANIWYRATFAEPPDPEQIKAAQMMLVRHNLS